MIEPPGISGAIASAGEATVRPRPTTRAYWICQILGWGGYCLGYYLAALVPFHEYGLKPTLADAVYGVVGLLGTHLLRMRLRAGGWIELRLSLLLPRLLLAALLVGAAQTAALDGTLFLEGAFSSVSPGAAPGILLATVFFSALLVGSWLAIYFVVLSVRRRRTAEVDALLAQVLARESQLRSLQQQLNPHFLFNCLNSLRGMIDEDPRRARDMVTELADLLRAALHSDKSVTVALSDELATVDTYLRLESVRLEERLQVRRAVDPAARAAAFPPLLLQGLVENAVRHGIAPLRGGGALTLRIEKIDDRLRVCVANSGTLRPSTASHHHAGTGLANARARLRLLYADQAYLDLREDPPGCVQATLEIPFQPAPVAAPTIQETPCAP